MAPLAPRRPGRGSIPGLGGTSLPGAAGVLARLPPPCLPSGWGGEPRSRTAPAVPKPIQGTPGDRRPAEEGCPHRSHGSSPDPNHPRRGSEAVVPYDEAARRGRIVILRAWPHCLFPLDGGIGSSRTRTHRGVCAARAAPVATAFNPHSQFPAARSAHPWTSAASSKAGTSSKGFPMPPGPCPAPSPRSSTARPFSGGTAPPSPRS